MFISLAPVVSGMFIIMCFYITSLWFQARSSLNMSVTGYLTLKFFLGK